MLGSCALLSPNIFRRCFRKNPLFASSPNQASRYAVRYVGCMIRETFPEQITVTLRSLQRVFMLRRQGLLLSAFAASLLVFSPLALPSRLVTTPEEWMARVTRLYEHESGNRGFQRRVSYSADDWPPNSGDLVRVNQVDVPLLETPSFIEPKLRISGIGRKGEVFQLLERRQLLFIINPLSGEWRAPNGNGVWARIRAIDGTEGWVFAGTRTAPVAYLSLIGRQTVSAPSPFWIVEVGLLVGLLVFLLFASVRSRRSKPSPQNERTSPTTSSSTSYDYPSYSGSDRQRIVDEEDDEETDRSSGTSRQSKGLIDLAEDLWEQTVYIPKLRKCPDCDGDATFDPQETGNGVCSECHGSGWNLDPLENEECPACGGEKKCQTCRGKGHIKD